LALAPIDFLLTRVVADDSFYYLTIARHIVSTGVPTFDGLAPTNGYHPLWLVVVSGVALFHSDPDVAFRLAMLVQVGTEAGCIFLLYRVATSLGSTRWTAHACSALYALSPVVLTHAGGMNGMETSLASLALLALLRVAVPVVTNSREPIPTVGIALSSSALVMARLDMAIACAAVIIVLFVQRRQDRHAQRMLALAALVPTALVGALLLVNVSLFGDPAPVSARSISWVSHTLLETHRWSLGEWAITIALNYIRTVTFVPFGPIAVMRTLAITTVIVIGAVILLLRYGCSFRQSRWNPGSGWLLGGLGLAWLAFGLAQSLRMPLLRSWYHGLWMVPATLVAGRLVEALRFGGESHQERATRERLILVGGVALIALGTVNAFAHRGRDAVKYDMAILAARIIPAGTRVGAWNAGIIGFFAPTLRVVNLDGVVNNEAWPYIRDRRLGAYARRTRIAYLVDDLGSYGVWSGYWSHEGESIRSGAVEYARLPIPNASDTIVLVGVVDDDQ